MAEPKEEYDYDDGESADDEPENIPEIARGLDAHLHNPHDPQDRFEGTDSALARFPGNALKWESNVFDDGTTYEGLTREGVPQGRGVMVFGNAQGGAGIQKVNRGDRYEGEFFIGYAHGLGQYTSANGEVYRGEFLLGKRHGCGSSVDMQPYYEAVAGGAAPDDAWARTRKKIEANARYGTWRRDLHLHRATPTNNPKRFCHFYEVKGVLQEMDSVVTRARMWQFKPDGDVTYFTAQDAYGTPVSTWQDPLHYPHDTKFLAPGPMGQCFPVPDDPGLRSEMAKHARNFQRIYDFYNLQRNPPPGSDLAKAHAQHAKRVAKAAARRERLRTSEARRTARLGRAAGEASQASEAGARSTRSALEDEDEDEEEEEPVKGQGRGATARRKAPQADEDDNDEDDDDEGGIDESELVASIPAEQQPGSTAPAGPGSVFGSIGLAWGLQPGLACSLRALRLAAAGAAAGFAERAQRRRSLTRPCRRASIAGPDGC